MILTIDCLLTPKEIQIIIERLSQAQFVDGKTTAGWHAKL
ncbi:MAG: PKHD-type hydroxylase, partial [Hydrococcus sp. RM1_1_31]|nr:PKHD-type hydroxylase [Hydrococcus sp. RM1_1_31]